MDIVVAIPFEKSGTGLTVSLIHEARTDLPAALTQAIRQVETLYELRFLRPFQFFDHTG